MAMTVRLPDELDAKLTQLARERHTSKHAILVEAAERFANTESKTARVVRIADDVTQRYAAVLERLADA